MNDGGRKQLCKRCLRDCVETGNLITVEKEDKTVVVVSLHLCTDSTLTNNCCENTFDVIWRIAIQRIDGDVKTGRRAEDVLEDGSSVPQVRLTVFSSKQRNARRVNVSNKLQAKKAKMTTSFIKLEPFSPPKEPAVLHVAHVRDRLDWISVELCVHCRSTVDPS